MECLWSERDRPGGSPSRLIASKPRKGSHVPTVDREGAARFHSGAVYLVTRYRHSCVPIDVYDLVERLIDPGSSDLDEFSASDGGWGAFFLETCSSTSSYKRGKSRLLLWFESGEHACLVDICLTHATTYFHRSNLLSPLLRPRAFQLVLPSLPACFRRSTAASPSAFSFGFAACVSVFCSTFTTPITAPTTKSGLGWCWDMHPAFTQVPREGTTCPHSSHCRTPCG